MAKIHGFPPVSKDLGDKSLTFDWRAKQARRSDVSSFVPLNVGVMTYRRNLGDL